MQKKRREVKLSIAAFVAERETARERCEAPVGVAWSAAETAPFYRPIDRPLTLGPDAVERLRRGW